MRSMNRGSSGLNASIFRVSRRLVRSVVADSRKSLAICDKAKMKGNPSATGKPSVQPVPQQIIRRDGKIYG
ncbi:hypothetical protein L6452_30636 [Arctium lappa]|uniref:Uncharacterized protein n=1 Tax=Arctium lappa TaxID=4217 RepID=A0ACB8ZIU5_ARCLA|nr:hypothetical protein L6452_30636 [Arctium lappa]